MFVRLYLKSDRHMYTFDDVDFFDISPHKFPSGKMRKCLTLWLDNGDTVNFAFAEVGDFVVENSKDEIHLLDDSGKILFVEDGKTYERS